MGEKPEAVRTQQAQGLAGCCSHPCHGTCAARGPGLGLQSPALGAAPGSIWVSPGAFSFFTAVEKKRKGFSLPLARLSLSHCPGSA